MNEHGGGGPLELSQFSDVSGNGLLDATGMVSTCFVTEGYLSHQRCKTFNMEQPWPTNAAATYGTNKMVGYTYTGGVVSGVASNPGLFGSHQLTSYTSDQARGFDVQVASQNGGGRGLESNQYLFQMVAELQKENGQLTRRIEQLEAMVNATKGEAMRVHEKITVVEETIMGIEEKIAGVESRVADTEVAGIQSGLKNPSRKSKDRDRETEVSPTSMAYNLNPAK